MKYEKNTLEKKTSEILSVFLFCSEHLHVKMEHTLIEKIFLWLCPIWILYLFELIQLVVVEMPCKKIALVFLIVVRMYLSCLVFVV